MKIRIRKNILLTIISLLIVFMAGFYFGRVLSADNILPPHYSCNQIARFHQDLLIRKYNIHDGFNTDPNHPRGDFNQRASDLNQELLIICNADPAKLK